MNKNYSIIPIKKKQITGNVLSSFKYFYEPTPNTNEQDRRPWFIPTPTYHINSDSLNETRNYDLERSKNTYRIITIGDSFTFGIGVDTDKNWAELLENELNINSPCVNKKYEVINLGVGGYDSEYAVERYRLRGQKYNPDLIIWLNTDFKRIVEKMLPLLDKYQQDGNNTDNDPKYKSWAFARNQVVKNMTKQDLINYQQEILNKFDSLYKKKLLLVSFPREDYINDFYKRYSESRLNTWLLMTKINFQDNSLFFLDKHFNQKGNEAFEKETYNFLKQMNLICM